jgi:1-deoxy-D-xylulose-5-phosphate reductoisomerase
VDTVTGGQNVTLLAQMAVKLNAKHAVIAEKASLSALQSALETTSIQVAAGREALLEAAARPVDISLQGIVGFAGVECSLVAAQHANVLALANKESLVCAGVLLKSTCITHGTTLLPVDSEHSAIFQCMVGEDQKTVERIILTASGGPFLDTPISEMGKVTAQQAADHPRWKMGLRISIDSASMFNKGMELIETKELFDISIDQLEVIVQPQSIVHSMVGYIDGSIMAHLGPSDMTGAIGYALNYPDRVALPLDRLDFAALGSLEFRAVDHAKFPAIELAKRVMALGGLAGSVYNGAKEQALDLFLDGQIGFLDMSKCVDAALNSYADNQYEGEMTVQAVIDQDLKSRCVVNEMVEGL